MLVIHFGLSKMNQFRTNDRIDRYMATNGIFCPVRLVLTLLKPDAELPLFPAFPAGVEAPKAVSYHGARIAFKKALELIGADPTDFGLHSGRTGGNLATMEAGLPLDVRGRKGHYESWLALGHCLEEVHILRLLWVLEVVRLTSAALSLEPKYDVVLLSIFFSRRFRRRQKALELIVAGPTSSAFFGESIVASAAFFLLCLVFVVLCSCLTRAGPARGPSRESELGP